MRQLCGAWKRFMGTFTGGGDARMTEEFETHIQMQAEDNIAAGMSPQQARRAAVLKFGGVEAAKESHRDQRKMPLLANIWQDAKFALRSFRRNPGFTITAVMSLALGIGATTSIFTAADFVLFRKLPYPDSERLATISLGGAISAPFYDAIRRQARSVEQGALFTIWGPNLAGAGEPERLPAAKVSAQLFSLLGVAPQRGRPFLPEEDRRGNENVVLLSDGLWKRKFGSDPEIVGKTLNLDGAPHLVAGIMPAGFRFPEGPEHRFTVGPFPPAEMWRPIALQEWEQTCKGCFNFAMLARLRPGFSTQDAATEIAEILKRHGTQPNLQVLRLEDAVAGKARTPVLLLLGAVTLAMLIACVNVANLLLARGLRRQSEMGIRLSLGASRARLVQQGLTEAALLGLMAAIVGVFLAIGGTQALVAMAPEEMPRIATAAANWRMFAFAFGLALATSIMFGLTPSILVTRGSLAGATRSNSRSATAAPSRLRTALVVAELAFSVILLVGSGLLARSFLSVAQEPLGFTTENTLTMRLSLPEGRYKQEDRASFVERLVNGCSNLPGVTGAVVTTTLPLTGESEGWGLTAEGSSQIEYTTARVRAVTPHYFRVLGIRMIQGRDFLPADRNADPVGVISESLARKLWPGVADPIGKRIASKRPITVVGVVADTRASGLDADIRPYLYVPFGQFAPPEFALAVRSTQDPVLLTGPIKQQIWRLDKDQPVTRVARMEQIVSQSIAGRRFPAVLMTAFAAFAVLLTAIGIYGVLSYSVAQRTQEIGVRMAMGASAKKIVTDLLKQTSLLTACGVGLGLLAAWCFAPLLKGLLYKVSVTEGSIFLGGAGLLAAVALLASLIPAWRAAHIDPARCLRSE